MRFQWDQANISHIGRHGVAPDEAEQVFFNSPREKGRSDRDGEVRFVLVGLSDAGRCLSVVFTERGDFVRVVTAFTATSKNRREYLEWRGK